MPRSKLAAHPEANRQIGHARTYRSRAFSILAHSTQRGPLGI